MKLEKLNFGFSNPRVILIAIISVILFVPSQTLHQNGDNLSSMEFFRLLNLVGSHPYSATSTSTSPLTTTTTPKPSVSTTLKPTFSSEKVKPMMEFLRAVKSLPPLTPEISMDERRQQLLESLSLLNSLIDKVSIPDNYNNDVTEFRSESRLSTEIVRPPTTTTTSTTTSTTMKPTTPKQQQQSSSTKLLPEKINENTGAIQQLSILNALLGGNGNANNVVDYNKNQQISEQQAQNAAQAALLTNFLIGLGGNQQQQQPQQSAQNFQSFQNTGLNLDAASSDQVNGLLSLLGSLGSLGSIGQQASTPSNIFSSLLQPQQQSAQQPNLIALLGSNGGLQQNPGLIESLANLASVVSNPYPSRPKVRGIDTRFGLGYRLGENADVQVVWEVGPQLFTDPLPNEVKARQIPQDSNQQNALASVQIPLVQKLTQSRRLEDVINVKNIESKKQEDSKVEGITSSDPKSVNFKDKPWPPPTVIEMRSGEMLDDYAVPVREFYQNRPKQMILPPQPRPYFSSNNNRVNRSPYNNNNNNNNNNRRFSSHPTPRYPNPLHSPNSQLTQYEKWLIQMSQNEKRTQQLQQQQQQRVQPLQQQHIPELRPQPIIERRIRRRKLLDRAPKSLDKKLSTNRFFKRSSLPFDEENASAGRDDSTYDDDDYADGSDQNDSQYDDDDYEDEKPLQKPNGKRPRPNLKIRPNRPQQNRPQQKQPIRPPQKHPHRRPSTPQAQASSNKQQRPGPPGENKNRMDMNVNNQMPPGRRRISGNTNQNQPQRPASIPGPTDPERIAMFNRQRQKLPTLEEVDDSFIRRNTMAHQIKLEEIQQRNKQMLEAQNQRRNEFLLNHPQHQHRNNIPHPHSRPPQVPNTAQRRGSNNNKSKIPAEDKKQKPVEEEYTVISNNKRIPSLSDPTLTESIMEKIQEYIPEKIKSTSSEIKEGILSKMPSLPSLPQVPQLPLMTNITRFFHMGSNVLNVKAYGQLAPGNNNNNNNRYQYKDQFGSGSTNVLKKQKPIVMIGEDISYKEIVEQLTKESNKTTGGRNKNKPGAEKLQPAPAPTPPETLLDPKSDPRPEVYIDISTGEVSVMRPVGELKSFIPETTTPSPVLDDVSEQTDEAFQEKDKQLFFQLQKNLQSYYEKVKLDKLKTIEAQKKKQANANHLQNYSSYFDLIETRRKRMMNGGGGGGGEGSDGQSIQNQ